MRISWNEYFMEMAKLAAKRSTCLRRQIGAVAVKDKHILSTGYNGPPPGHPHCEELGGCLREQMKVPSGERHELCAAVHAEQNIICQAALHGIALAGAIIYCTAQPCSICAKMIVSAGIEQVIYLEGYPDQRTIDILGDRLVRFNKTISITKEKCKACNGRGFFLAPDNFADRCPYCNGTGIVA